MIGHDETPAVVIGQLLEPEELLRTHIAVEIGETQTDRALFFIIELLVELLDARKTETDQAIKLVMRGEAQRLGAA